MTAQEIANELHKQHLFVRFESGWRDEDGSVWHYAYAKLGHAGAREWSGVGKSYDEAAQNLVKVLDNSLQALAWSV